MTQLEMTTSTLASAQRQLLEVALDELDVLDAGRGRVGARELEHLVGHVEADRAAARRDAAGADQHVGAGARAEVEHDVAVAQVGDGGRHAAAQRRLHGRARRRPSTVVVERAAEDLVAGGVVEADRRAARRARRRRRAAARRRGSAIGSAAGAPPAIAVAAAA